MRLTVVVALLAGVIGLLSGDSGLRVVAPFFGVLICVQLYPLLRGGEIDLFDPPTFSGIYVAFGMVATVAGLATEGTLTLRFLEFLREDQTLALTIEVILATVLGLGAYYVGYYHPRWGPRWSKFVPNVARPSWSTTRLHVAGIALLAVFALTYAVFQGRLGVSMGDPTALAAAKAVWRDDPTLSWMIRGSQFGLLASLIYFAGAAARPGMRALAASAGLLAINAWLVSRQGQRGSYLFPLVVALGTFHYLRRRIPVAVFVALLFVALALANLQLGWRRSATSDVEAGQEFERVWRRPTQALAMHEDERGRFAALALVFHHFPDQHPHLLGETYAGLVATFIPRWLWPDKVNYFQWRDTMIVMRLAGAPVPTSYLAVLYVNWSWIGIVLGMIAWGVFHRAIYEALLRSPRDPGATLLYMSTLVFFNPTLLGVSWAVQYVLPAYVAVRFIAGRLKQESGRPGRTTANVGTERPQVLPRSPA